MNKLQNLLDEVSKKALALKTAQSLYSRQLAPKFNIFDYINTNELGLSRILADLIDPKGSHAQNSQFLKLFLKYCLPNIDMNADWKSFTHNIDKVQVFTEEVNWKSGSLRRMDIYLSYTSGGESFGICIENKPYANDQYMQLEDYATELRSRHNENWHIVYLNEYNEKPSEISVNSNLLDGWIKNNKFTSLRYSNLIEWLKACQLESQNHSVTEFIAQLRKFIQWQFMGIEDMNESNMIIEVMQQTQDSLESSFKIANSIDSMKKQLIQKLKKDLVEIFESNNDYELNLHNLGDGQNYEQVNLMVKGYEDAYISFEFQTANFSQPYIGIKFNSEEKAKQCAQALKMKDVLSQAFPNKDISVSPLWPAGFWFDYKDWKGSHIPWVMIKENEMAPLILTDLKKIYFSLKEGGCFKKE